MTRGETLCWCGWRKGPVSTEWSAKFEALPPCSRCSSLGMLGGPRELDRAAIAVAEAAGNIPPMPFGWNLWLCSCPRGDARKQLAAFAGLALLSPSDQDSLERQLQLDTTWWKNERSRRGLVIRDDPAADQRTLDSLVQHGAGAS
ncbi:MAG: hypothetical protein IH849_09520 [Acidobacteria bacterium]|nr:hypothetical protein [Acidobacteriota bacterium]